MPNLKSIPMEISFIPLPGTISVNWIWFQVLLVSTFVLHMILVNLMLGGGLFAIWDCIKGLETNGFSKKIPIMVQYLRQLTILFVLMNTAYIRKRHLYFFKRNRPSNFRVIF